MRWGLQLDRCPGLRQASAQLPRFAQQGVGLRPRPDCCSPACRRLAEPCSLPGALVLRSQPPLDCRWATRRAPADFRPFAPAVPDCSRRRPQPRQAALLLAPRRIGRARRRWLARCRSACDFCRFAGPGHHMHDMKARCFQFGQKLRQRRDGHVMNVMKQQDALAACLEPAQRQARDVGRPDSPMPIVGDGVGAEYHQRTVGQLLLDRVAARQAGNPEEWGEVFLIPQRTAYIRDAAVDLGPNLVDRHLLHAKRMMLAVRADRVSFLVDAPHDGGKFARHFADEKEGSLDALAARISSTAVECGGIGPSSNVSTTSLSASGRLCAILHHADMLDFARVDDKNAARSERIRMAGAVLRKGQGGEEGWRD